MTKLEEAKAAKPRKEMTEGVFLVSTKNAFVLVERVYNVNTYEFQLSHKRESKVSERASERSEYSGANKWSGASERT